MATLKETFSQQLQDLQADFARQSEQHQALTQENEGLKAQGEWTNVHDIIIPYVMLGHEFCSMTLNINLAMCY